MADEKDPVYNIVVDTVQRRPACVILQAIYNGNRHIVSSMFPARSWLVSPTPDLAMVEGKLSEWRKFAEDLKKRFPSI